MWPHDWLEHYPKINFALGDAIISSGETNTYCYYLISGIAARTLATADGDDIILKYFQSGKMLGYHLRQFGATAELDFIVKTPCTCYKIPWQDVDALVRQNGDLCYALMEEMTEECDFWATSYIAHSLGGGISVLCLSLSFLAKPQANGTHKVHPMFTNIELGHYCGVHPVSVSRLLSKLTHEGILERTKEGLVIYDMAALSSYIKIGE